MRAIVRRVLWKLASHRRRQFDKRRGKRWRQKGSCGKALDPGEDAPKRREAPEEKLESAMNAGVDKLRRHEGKQDRDVRRDAKLGLRIKFAPHRAEPVRRNMYPAAAVNVVSGSTWAYPPCWRTR